MEQSVVIHGAHMSSSLSVDNKGKDILILGKGPTQGSDDTTLTAEAAYPFTFTQPNKKFVLSLHYNGNNSFLFANATKMFQFKAKDFEIKDYAFSLGDTSNNFTINNIKKGIKRSCKFSSVDFNPIDTKNILDIHKYLMKRK